MVFFFFSFSYTRLVAGAAHLQPRGPALQFTDETGRGSPGSESKSVATRPAVQEAHGQLQFAILSAILRYGAGTVVWPDVTTPRRSS